MVFICFGGNMMFLLVFLVFVYVIGYLIFIVIVLSFKYPPPFI